MIVEQIFLILGAIIFIGFFSALFFERTKVSDVIILLFLGILLGPVLKVVDPAYFLPFAPFIGALALIIILFESGLGLNLFKVLTELSIATGFTVLTFVLTLAAVGGLLHFVFGWALLHALLLGAVIGGTTSAIVIPVLNRLNASSETKVFLSLESVMTDALCIVVAVALISLIRFDNLGIGDAAHFVASAFSIAAVAGFVFGLFWMGVLQRFYKKPFGYFITIAAIFALYAVVNSIGGNGAIAVLIFGLVLGNSTHLSKMLRMKEEFPLDPSIKIIQREVSFFVKTFFYVYLGVVFSLNALTLSIVGVSIAVLLAILVARWIAVKVLAVFDHSKRRFGLLIFTMLPRGLAAAVLAFFPFQQGITIQNFVEVVFLIILFTNILTTIGAFAFEHTQGTPLGQAPVPVTQAPKKAEANPQSKPRIIRKIKQ